MKIVAFVPAKGSSDRVKNKNLSILDGEYLFKRKLKQLLDCHQINEVILDTEDDVIADLASDLPVTVIKRPVSLASNATDGHELFAWERSQVEADVYIQALCTAPFLDAGTVGRALDALLESPDHDSLIAVRKEKQYIWNGDEPAYGRGRIPNSVDLSQTVIEAMSLYIVRSSVGNSGKRFGSKPLLFDLSPSEAVDVNWPMDLDFAESIAAGVRARENLQLQALAPYITSAMLSDISRELGMSVVLPKDIRGEGRFLGRAKTLLLDRVQEGESWRNIYSALDSYQFVRPGDVLMVENRVVDRAYFGNLNAQLALRAGAVGAVIDGVTRDHDDVKRLGIPVFSRGHYCVDIKFDGTVRSMNKPIQMGEVEVCPGDIVFGDPDGVAVIPLHAWPKIKSLALEGIKREWKIGMAVAVGMPAMDIHQALGDF